LKWFFILILVLFINNGYIYSQSNEKKYDKVRKVDVGTDKKQLKQEKKAKRKENRENRENRKKVRLGKRSARKSKKGLAKQSKYSIDKDQNKRSKKTKTAYDELLKNKSSDNAPTSYASVMDQDEKDAKLKRKVAKKLKKERKKQLKNLNFGKEKGQVEQDRVFIKIRKAEKKTKRVQKGKHPDPWIKRVFRNSERKKRVKKKE